MTLSNKETLDSYNERTQEYIDGTPHEVSTDFKKWIDATLSHLDTDSRILELGSAFGRDADYLESRGFQVHRSDAASGFVEYLQNAGKEVRQLNVLNDELGGPYDLVFANAVLLHLNEAEMLEAIQKVYDSLDREGVFSFSLKRGSGSEWSDAKLGAKRFFQYWELNEIEEELKKVGFRILSSTDTADNDKWLHLITQR